MKIIFPEWMNPEECGIVWDAFIVYRGKEPFASKAEVKSAFVQYLIGNREHVFNLIRIARIGQDKPLPPEADVLSDAEVDTAAAGTTTGHIVLNVKFPDGMSARDKEVIGNMFLEHYKGHNFKSQRDAHDAFGAFVTEHCAWLGSRIHGRK